VDVVYTNKDKDSTLTDLITYVNKHTHRCAVLVHGMGELVILGIASKEETLLAHVEIEALEATITEAHNWILFAYVALGLMLCRFCGSQTMQHGQPDETLWLVLQPAKKVLQFC